MNESARASMSIRVLSWIGVAVSILVILGLLVAAALVYELKFGDAEQASGLLFLFVTSWLLLLGAGTAVLGGLGMALAKGDTAVRKRSRIVLIIGIVALVVGGLFGVSPFA